MTVDRAALIDTAVDVIARTLTRETRSWSWDNPLPQYDAERENCRADAREILGEVLPLIADFIEDELTRPYKVPGDPESYFTTTDTWNNAVETAAHRIRMLVPASTERI